VAAGANLEPPCVASATSIDLTDSSDNGQSVRRYDQVATILRRFTMSHRIALRCAVAVAVSLARPALMAHHSFAGVFDGNKVIRLKGVITRFDAVNPHSMMYVDTKGNDGNLERWALEGPSIVQLARRGLDNNKAFRIGESIQACGYLKKDDASPPGHEASRQSAARLVSAELLTLSDGEQVVWSNYGQGKCLLNVAPVPKAQGEGAIPRQDRSH